MAQKYYPTNEEAERALRKLWGSNYQTRLQKVKEFIREVGGDDLIKHLNETGLGNVPSLAVEIYGIAHGMEQRFKDTQESGIYTMYPTQENDALEPWFRDLKDKLCLAVNVAEAQYISTGDPLIRGNEPETGAHSSIDVMRELMEKEKAEADRSPAEVLYGNPDGASFLGDLPEGEDYPGGFYDNTAGKGVTG